MPAHRSYWMHHFVSCLLALAMLAASIPAQADEPVDPAPGFRSDQELLRLKGMLDAHLGSIYESARTNRQWGGGIMLGAGLLIGGGAIALAATDESVPAQAGAVVLGAAGGAFTLTGILVLLVKTDFEELPAKYFALADHDLLTKVSHGEALLSSLASKGEQGRYLNGGVALALGAAEIGTSFSFDDEESRRSMLYSGISFAAVGLLVMIIKSPAEREYELYKDERAGLSSALSFTEVLEHMALLPVEGGMLAGFGGQW